MTARRLSRGRDRELEAGSRAHYEDAAYYTKTYRARTEDVSFYERLARASGGPVLEYGVGNGRVALPVARAGVEVTGVDLSRPMLDDLRAKLAGEPAEVRRRVRLRQGDMREVRLGRRFPLVVCPFNAILHLYVRDDFERFFARVRAHLAPGGRFVFDASVPSPVEQSRDPNRAYSSPRLRHPTTNEIVRYSERFDHDPARQLVFVMMEFAPERDPKRAWSTPLTHRQLYPLETEALLHYNGLDVESVAGDWEGGPLDRYSDVAVWTCKVGKGARRRG